MNVLSAYCPKSPDGKLQVWFQAGTPEDAREHIGTVFLDQHDGPRNLDEAWEMLTTMGWVIVHLRIAALCSSCTLTV